MSKLDNKTPGAASGQTCDWHQDWHVKENAKGLGGIFLSTWRQVALRHRKCTATVFRWAAGPGPPPPNSILGTSACAFVPQRCSDCSQSAYGLPCCLLQTQPPQSLSSPTLPAPSTAASRAPGNQVFQTSYLCWTHHGTRIPPTHTVFSLSREQDSWQTEAGGYRHMGPRDPTQSQPGELCLQLWVSDPGIQDVHMKTRESSVWAPIVGHGSAIVPHLNKPFPVLWAICRDELAQFKKNKLNFTNLYFPERLQ